MQIISVLLLSLICLFPMLACSQQDFSFASMNCVNKTGTNDFCEPITVSGKLYLPEMRASRLVTITHGSQGLDARHTSYAQELVKNGIAALVIDHWGARGIGKAQFNYLLNNQKGARAFNQALDAIKAMNQLKASPYSFEEFGFLGESMGGVAALWLEKNYFYKEYSRVFNEPSRVNLQSIVALYPHCDERNYDLTFNKVPTLIIAGELDNDTPAKYCQTYVEWVRNVKFGNIVLKVLGGQYHDFDAPYPLLKANRAQNPADCVSTIKDGRRTWDLTLEAFPLSAKGYSDYVKKCMKIAGNDPPWSGHTGDQKTGFDTWIQFFLNNMTAAKKSLN